MSRGFLRAALICVVTVFFTFPPSTGFPGNFATFGPQNYTRGTASPVVVTNAFTVLNPNTSYTLKVNNGGLVGGQFEKVSSAVISLNGVQIVGPNEFNQNVTLIEKPVTLAASNQLSVELRGKPGGGITVQIIGVDNDPPTITASVNPAPNTAGWHRTDVTVGFTCLDATSGIASCPNPLSVSAEGVNQVVSGTAVDRAGNTASISVTLNIDKTPPTLSPTITSQPNLAGWNKSDVTVSFTCADSTSGVASCPAPITVSTEAANQLVSGTATDLAGNSATASVTVSLDKSAPAVAITAPSNGSSVSGSPVRVTGTATDNLSGITTVLCNGSPASFAASTFFCDVPLTNGPNTVTVEATDIAGNKASSAISVTLGEPLQPQSPPVVFGPRIFTQPDEAVSFLVTNPAGPFWLQVFNGQDSQNLVDSAAISINGIQVAGPTDFTPNPFGFQKDVTLQVGNTLEVELSGAAGSFITIEIREAKLNPGVPNTEGDLVGRNIGTSTYLGWVETEGATEYRVLKSTSVNGPWTEMGRSARTGADDISPEINTADLCYKIEALNDLAEVIRVYDPICVPKFVEPQTQSFNLQRSLPAPENTITRTAIRDDPVRLASLNPLAIAANVDFLPERTVQVKNAEPNPGVPNSAGDLVGRNIGTSTYLGWTEAEGATEYRVLKSASVNGPWTEMGRSARTGADDISPNVRTMDLCYKVEALDALDNVIRSYEPVCVPKFVEMQSQSFAPGGSSSIKKAALSPASENVQQTLRNFSSFSFFPASASDSAYTNNDLCIIPGNFLTVEIREADPNPTVSNSQVDLTGTNMGDEIFLSWDFDDSAAEYVVFRAPSLSGPWTERFRFDRDAAMTGGVKVDVTPDARLMDLCYKLEARDGTGRIVRRYEPICVPKFVEPRTQSIGPKKSPTTGSFLQAQVTQAEPNVTVSNQKADLSGINEGHAVGLVWSDDDRAAEYVVSRANSIQGPWQELFRVPRDRSSYMDFTPDARLRQLCYRVEAVDASGTIMRRYEPVCVPKFVERQGQSLNHEKSLIVVPGTATGKTQWRPQYSLQLASLNLMADAPDPRINGLCFANPDPEFTDWKSRGSLDESGIRTFLKDHGSSLQFIVPDLDVGGQFNAALEIFNAAKNFQINPEVLLTLMEKEKPGSVTSPKLARDALRLLMGWDPQHRVVLRDQKTARGQVQRAAKQLRSDFDTVAAGGETLGGWKRDREKLTVDGVLVKPSNNPATVLYAYDPYAGRQRGGNTAFGGNARFCEIWESFGFKREPVAISPQNPTLVCGPNASVTLTASGGRPGPNGYTWSITGPNLTTTVGVLTVTGVNKQNVQIKPPDNSANKVPVSVAAYLYCSLGALTLNANSCVPLGFSSPVTIRQNFGCADNYLSCEYSGLPPCDGPNLPAFNNRCVNCDAGGLPQTFGQFHNTRSQAMSDAGCRPCRIEMQGVTVTVTDAAGAPATTTVTAQ